MFLFQLFAFAHFFGFGFPLYTMCLFFFVQVWWSFLHILCSKQTISFLLPAGRTAKRNGIEDTENRQNFTFCGQLLNVLTAVPAAIHFGRSPLFSALTFCESCWWWMPHSPFEESSIRPDPIQSWSAHSSTRSWAAGMCLCFPTFFIRSRFGC